MVVAAKLTWKGTPELLWKYYCKRNRSQECLSLRNTIALKNILLVRKQVRRMADQNGEPYEDLEQIGSIGLIRAIERFDPTLGVSFSSFAVPYIRGEILHFLRDRTLVKVPRRWREMSAAANNAERVWANQHGRLPSEKELAVVMGIKVEKLREVRSAIANQNAVNLDDDRLVEIEDRDYLEVHPTGKLEAAWTRLHEKLSALEFCDRQLIEAIYFQHLSLKAAAKLFALDGDTLQKNISRILMQIAT